MEQMEKDFIDYIKKMQAYEEAINVMYWDMRTGAPKKELNNVLKLSECFQRKRFKC